MGLPVTTATQSDTPVIKERAKKTAAEMFVLLTWAKDDTRPVGCNERREASAQLVTLRAKMQKMKPAHPNYVLGHEYLTRLSGKVVGAQKADGYITERIVRKDVESDKKVDAAAVKLLLADTAQQTDGTSCGVYAALNALALARGSIPSRQPGSERAMRALMAFQLITGRIEARRG